METDRDWVPQVDKSPLSCFYGIQDLAEPKKFLEKYELGSNAQFILTTGRASGERIRPYPHAKYAGEAWRN